MMQSPPPYVPFVEYVLKALEHPPYMYVAKLAASCTTLFLTRENPELLQELCEKWAARFTQDRRRLISHIRKRASYCISSPDSAAGLCREAKVSSEDASEDSSAAIACGEASAEEEEAMNCSDAERAVEHLLSILNTLVPMYFSWNWHRADYVIQINKEYAVYIREYILPMCAELAPEDGVDDAQHTPWLLPPHTYLEPSQSVSSFYTPTSTVSPYPRQRSPRRLSSMVGSSTLPAPAAGATGHTPRQPPPPPSGLPSWQLGASQAGSPTTSATDTDGLSFPGMQQHYPTGAPSKGDRHSVPLPKFSPKTGKRGAEETAAIAAPAFTPASTQASSNGPSYANAVAMSPNVVTGRAFNAAAVYGLRFLSLGNYREALLRNTTGLVTVFHAKYSARSNEIIDALQSITTKRLLNPMPTIAVVYGVAEPELSSLYKVSWFPTVVYTPPLRYQKHRHRKMRANTGAASGAGGAALAAAAAAATSTAAAPGTAAGSATAEHSDNEAGAGRKGMHRAGGEDEEEEDEVRSLCATLEIDSADSDAASPVQRMKLSRADTAEGLQDSPRPPDLHAHHPLADSALPGPPEKDEEEEDGAAASVANGSGGAASAISVSSLASAAVASSTAKARSPAASPCRVATTPVVALTDVSPCATTRRGRSGSERAPGSAAAESLSAPAGGAWTGHRGPGSCSVGRSPNVGAHPPPAPPTPTELLFGFSVGDGVPGPSAALAATGTNGSALSNSSFQSSAMGETLYSVGESGTGLDGTTESLMEMLAHDDHVIYPMDGVQTVPALVEWISSRGASVPRLRKMKEFFNCIKYIRKEEKFKRYRELHSAVVTLRRLQGIKDDPMMGGAGNSTSSSGSAPSTSSQPQPQQPDQPLFIFLGGGMAAGKTTAVAALAKSSWWESHKEQSVVVNADEFKLPMDCELPSAEAHTHSTRAAENLLVKAINQGRSIVLDGTMMWKPFVQQVVAMVREAHLTLYKQGPGYNKNTRTERYFIAHKSRTPALPMPYKIIFLGITVEVETAVPRGFLRKFQTNRGVPLSMQLRSFKLFAENFADYVALVDETTLYNNNIFVDLEKGELPPVLAECTEETNHQLLVHDEAAFQLFLRQRLINDNADNILEVYPATASSQ